MGVGRTIGMVLRKRILAGKLVGHQTRPRQIITIVRQDVAPGNPYILDDGQCRQFVIHSRAFPYLEFCSNPT